MGDNKAATIEGGDFEEVKPNPYDLRCAPHLKFSNGSCLDMGMLVKMAVAYNESNPKNVIVLNDTNEIMSPGKYKQYLVHQFKKRLSNCDDQKCWTQQEFIKNIDGPIRKRIVKQTFRPYGPVEGSEQFKWLNTTNLDEVMEQYELEYPGYKYLGTFPVDADEWEFFPLQKMDFGGMVKKGVKRVSMTWNMDKHDESGSHWCPLFIDFGTGLIAYSDSYAVDAPKGVKKFMGRMGKFMKNELGVTPVVKINRKMVNQKGDSECGLFSAFFQIRMLQGESFEEIHSRRVSDEEVNKLRSVFFIKKKGNSKRM